MLKKFLVLTLSAWSVIAFGQATDSLKHKPEVLPGWTSWVPGASYYYQGKIIQGSIFSTIELGGVYFGIRYNKSLKNNSSSPYYNYPLIIGLQVFQTEKLTMLKHQLETIKYYKSDFKYDDLSEKDLYLAPFKAKNIFTPITGGMVMLAAAFLSFEKYNETNRFNDVEKMYLLDRYIDRNQGLGVFGLTSVAMGWGAGIGEEYMCRNWMMPILDYKYGQRKGLIISSMLFGGVHFANIIFADKPDYKSALLQVGQATIIGYILGNDVQKRGYNIGPAVAAHVWYDFTQMLGSFLINPKNNFLGVDLKFNL